MRAAVWSELDADLPADDVWALYSSPDLSRLLVEVLMPDKFVSIDFLEGDGHEGTVLHIVMNPANKGPHEWNEKFVKIDHDTRTKIVRKIEGGYLDIGFNLYQNTFQVTETGPCSCVIRATVDFDLKEGFESQASLVSASWTQMKAMVDYIKANKKTG